MAKIISQAMFDEVVKENIQEFDMEAQEAMNDASQQFEAQGIDLSNIVRDASIYGSGDTPAKHSVVEATEALFTLAGNDNQDTEKVQDALGKIKTECDIDLAHRLLAGKNGAYSALVATLKENSSQVSLLVNCLSTLCSLCNGQPDLLEDIGSTHLLDMLKTQKDNPDLCSEVIRLIKLNCIKHEGNRVNFVDKGLIPALMVSLDAHTTHGKLVKETCGALRVLTLDDDLRVPFGKGHEHAKLIVTEEEALKKIMNICNEFGEDKDVLGELFSTLARLAVRDEFCQEIMDLGGLSVMLKTLDSNLDSLNLTRQVLGVLKAIAGNDNVKVAIVTSGGLQHILSAMSKHQRNAGIQEVGCAALTMILLRQPNHCRKLMELKGHEVILKAMQLHPDVPMVQKSACMAIRNLVARTREFNVLILEQGGEALIQKAMNTHKECRDDGKAALRDLDCKVELKELWTGEGRGIHA